MLLNHANRKKEGKSCLPTLVWIRFCHVTKRIMYVLVITILLKHKSNFCIKTQSIPFWQHNKLRNKRCCRGNGACRFSALERGSCYSIMRSNILLPTLVRKRCTDVSEKNHYVWETSQIDTCDVATKLYRDHH